MEKHNNPESNNKRTGKIGKTVVYLWGVAREVEQFATLGKKEKRQETTQKLLQLCNGQFDAMRDRVTVDEDHFEEKLLLDGKGHYLELTRQVDQPGTLSIRRLFDLVEFNKFMISSTETYTQNLDTGFLSSTQEVDRYRLQYISPDSLLPPTIEDENDFIGAGAGNGTNNESNFTQIGKIVGVNRIKRMLLARSNTQNVLLDIDFTNPDHDIVQNSIDMTREAVDHLYTSTRSVIAAYS